MADPPQPKPVISLGGAVRRLMESSVWTVIAPAYEHRTIVVAQGIEFNNDQIAKAEKIPEGVRRLLRRRGLAKYLDVEPDGTAHYVSHRQRVRFTIKRVNTRTAFKEALKRDGELVIYDGHARYGRGPCFGTDKKPGDQWGNGAGPETGMWRVGFPYVGVPFGDILKHKYRTRIATKPEDEEAPDGGRPPRDDCHPHVRKAWRRLEALTFEQIVKRLGLKDDSRLLPYIEGAEEEPGARYWTYRKWDEGRRKRYAVLHAGWKETAAKDMDLGATELKCRVFCHFGCSTLVHNYPVLRKLKKWERTETDRFAYWTTRSSWGPTTARFIYYLLTYRKRNAFLSWRPSLRSARAKTNWWLSNGGYTFRIR